MQQNRLPGPRDGDDPRLSRKVGHSHAVELTAQLDVHAADHERTLSHREGADNLEAEGGADEPWRGEIHCGTDVFETEAVCYCGAERAVVGSTMGM